MTKLGALERLQSWYASHCDGEWEHGFGVQIETLDNPGWMVRIHLDGTRRDGMSMEPAKIERTEDDWLTIFIRDNQLQGACGPTNLAEMLEVMLDSLE